MDNLKNNDTISKESGIIITESSRIVNTSKYVEMIHEYIQRKNNTFTSSTYNSDTKRPQLVLASRVSENPICIIDRTTDSIYRIKIEKSDITPHNKNNDIITTEVSSDKMYLSNTIIESTESRVNLHITLHDTNDVLQVEHSVVYRLDTPEDKLFRQLIPGIFVNSIY